MKRTIILFLVLSLVLSGCGQQQKESGKKKLVLASFGTSPELENQVAIFNEGNERYSIEIEQYNRYEEGDGIDRLQKEIVSGRGPDIINFGREYMITDIVGNYTENLSPYFQKMEEEEDICFFTNILQAFSYQDNLCVVPVGFTLQTYVGRSSMVGNGNQWSVEDLIRCYEENREKKGEGFMLYPGETKKDVLGSLLMGSIENYVDWENGTCRFDSEEFCRVLSFAGQFPDTLNLTEDFSAIRSFQNGNALLYPMVLNSVFDICRAEIIMGDPVNYIGYPVCDESSNGSIIQASEMVLAISGASHNKEAAWEFISQLLQTEYQENFCHGFPINKSAFEAQVQKALHTEYEDGPDGVKIPVAKDEVRFEGETGTPIYQIEGSQAQILEQVIGKATISSSYDSTLHAILLEEADGYFSGDKTLEQTVAIMQKRAMIYMSEEKKDF